MYLFRFLVEVVVLKDFAQKDYTRFGRLSRCAWARLRERLVALGLLMVLSTLVWAAPLRADISVNVPIDHWGYRFIERFETKGVLHGLGDGIKPFSRGEMAIALDRVRRAVAQGYGLSRVESSQLTRLLDEFEDELPSATSAKRSVRTGFFERAQHGHMPLLYRTERGEIGADFLVRQQSDWRQGRAGSDDEKIYRNRVGGIVQGRWNDLLGFRLAFEQTREQGSRRYILRDDVFERRLEFVQLKGGLADFHQGTAYLTFALPFAKVLIGKDEVRWGPAPGDNLGLSNNAPSYDMISLRSRLGAFKLVSIAGFLRPCPDRPDSPLCAGVGSEDSYIVNGVARRLEREKYMSAHRLEVALAPWIDVGFQEVVIYGDRGPEWTYLNPFMFYWAAQSYLGDKDNMMMGFDVDMRPLSGLRLYAAYVVDDLKKLKIFTNDFANKFSLQSGLLWIDPLRVADSDFRAEYVRIEPWIFTHKIPINTFRHFDSPLGHALGPNSDRWRLGLMHRPSRDWEVEIELSRTRHGDNAVLDDGSILNVGGDLHLGWRAGDERDNKDFLAGTRWQSTLLGGQVQWRFLPHATLKLGWGYEWGKNVPLPPRDSAAAALKNRSGYGDGGQQRLSFELRYGLM
jgi:hypothetical protein